MSTDNSELIVDCLVKLKFLAMRCRGFISGFINSSTAFMPNKLAFFERV